MYLKIKPARIALAKLRGQVYAVMCLPVTTATAARLPSEHLLKVGVQQHLGRWHRTVVVFRLCKGTPLGVGNACSASTIAQVKRCIASLRPHLVIDQFFTK